jgi:hypothetical protein
MGGGGFNPQMMQQKGMMQKKGGAGFNPQMMQQMQKNMGPMGPMGGMPGPAGMAGANEGETAEPEFSSHVVLAFFEMRSVPKTLAQQSPPIAEVDHNFGRKGRFPVVDDKIIYTIVRKESVTKEFAKKFNTDLREAKDPARLSYAASWALAHGLTKDFHTAMATLAKAEPKHPAVANYLKVQADLKNAPTTDDPATQAILAEIKGEGYRLAVSDAGHYGILTKLPATPQSEGVLRRRLNRFEETYENFFYWFALQEGVQPPPMPKHRLYVLLLDAKEDFTSRHVWWGAQPMVADGFTPRRDNIIVLSGKRLDENYTIFEKNVQILMSAARVSREELISGAIWDRPEGKNNVHGIAGLQTLVLMQKAMEEEAERASISHEAARQLLFATGLLPRCVNVPEWAQFGLASYFDVPYGALYRGVGLPSWTNLISFKHYRRANKLGGSAYECLLRTISDRFFREAARAEEDFKENPDKEKKDDKVKEHNDIARGSAWALTYYLLQEKKLPQLMKYMEEMNNLPRDLELDDRALQGCFARAFDLIDARDPRRLDPVKTTAFANAWFSFMLGVNLEVGDAEDVLTAYRFPAPRRATTQPNQYNPGVNPMLPGGARPMLPNAAPPMPMLP